MMRAGFGHTVKYLDRTKVQKYIALEPNTRMHAEIRAKAVAAGFSEAAGSLLILGCGAEDLGKILAAVPRESVDAMVAVLTICSFPTSPAPEAVLEALVRALLRPGGALLFYEHVRSPRADVAHWQRFWTPVWCCLFDGCRLDRPTHLWVKNMHGVWREGEAWGNEGEPDEHLFWHQTGRYIRA
jgi:SAM-dependent methyltransferase